jgi:hypothetical protein
VAVTIWHGTGNPSMALFGRALDAAGVERVAFPTIPVDFERTAEGFGGLLRQAGWSGVASREAVWTHREDPEVWWSGAAGGVANIGLLVSRQTPETVARIKAAYDRLAAEIAAEDGRIGLPAVALLASAKR